MQGILRFVIVSRVQGDLRLDMDVCAILRQGSEMKNQLVVFFCLTAFSFVFSFITRKLHTITI